MTRRKALMALFAVSGASVLTGIAYKWLSQRRIPDVRFLLSKEDMLAELAEIIIPGTDVPGAKDAQVGKAMVHLVQALYRKKDLNNFIDGLKNVDIVSRRKFGFEFMRLTSDQKQIVFREIHHEAIVLRGNAAKIRDKIVGKSFVTVLKEITTISFCTSQVGATRALEYVKIPVVYSSCISISPAKRAWALK